MTNNLDRSIIYDQDGNLSECDTWAAILIIALRIEIEQLKTKLENKQPLP